MTIKSTALVLALGKLLHSIHVDGPVLIATATSQAFAQYGSGYGNPDSSGSGSGSGGSNPYSSGGNGNNPYGSSSGAEYQISHYQTMIIAHAVLASVAFVFLFPVGGIIIRLASFPGLWWVHGLFQTFAYLLYM